MAHIRMHVKTPAPTFFQNKSSEHPHIYLIFVIQMFINVFLRFVFVRIFFLHFSRESNNIYILFLFNYIFINLFIKIMNLINDDCI